MIDNLELKMIMMTNSKAQLPDDHQVETMHDNNDTKYNDTHKNNNINQKK